MLSSKIVRSSGNKWRHYEYISCLHEEYVRNNKYLQVSNEKHVVDYYTRFCGRIIQHLDKHCQLILRDNVNTSKWAYNGLVLIILYNWKYIHIKDKIVLLVSIIKTLKALRTSVEELNAVEVLASLRSFKDNNELYTTMDEFMKFVLSCNELMLNDITSQINSSDFNVNKWKLIYNDLERWGNYGAFNNIEEDDNLFIQLINSCNMIKDYIRLSYIIYWLYKINYNQLLLRKPLILLINKFKCRVNYHHIRDLINFLFYISCVPINTCEEVKYLLNQLDEFIKLNYNRKILTLKFLDCTQLLDVLFNYVSSSTFNPPRSFSSILMMIILNIEFQLNKYKMNNISVGESEIISGDEKINLSGNIGFIYTDLELIKELALSIFGTDECIYNFNTNNDENYNWNVILMKLKKILPHLSKFQPCTKLIIEEIENLHSHN